MAPLVTMLPDHSLEQTVAQVNAATSNPVTIFLPDGAVAGAPAPRSPAVELALRGESFSTSVPGGVAVLVAVDGLPKGTAVIRSFVPDSVLRHGVTRAWLLLLGIGAFLLLLSLTVADQLARSLVRPLTAVAHVADRLASGELTARAAVPGPPEVRRAGHGLNRLATRIGDLLAQERETVADLSHRLRTPLTALRINAESLRNPRLLEDVAAVERAVSEVIRQARRQSGDAHGMPCDAVRVVAERAAFWRPLAEDQERPMSIEVVCEPAVVQVSPDDLATCVTSCWRTSSRTPPKGRVFASGSVTAPAGVPGWWWRTTDLVSPPVPRSGAAAPAAARPASAWTSREGSPRSRVAR